MFETKERAARLAQNPRTLEKVKVPSKRIVKFKVGRMMRERVSGEDETPSGDEIAHRSAGKPAPERAQAGGAGVD